MPMAEKFKHRRSIDSFAAVAAVAFQLNFLEEHLNLIKLEYFTNSIH